MTKRDAILRVLQSAGGSWVSGAVFLSGDNPERVRCSAYSQRIGDLIEAGEPIERKRVGSDGLAQYRYLVPSRLF